MSDDTPTPEELIQRVVNIVANLAHPFNDHTTDALEDEAHDHLRELRKLLASREAEIATLRQERDTLMPEYNSVVALLEMERDRSEAAEAENARLRAGLQRAVETIRTWHGMGLSDTEQKAWTLYQASPEMQAINALLAPPAGTPRAAVEFYETSNTQPINNVIYDWGQ